MNQLMVARGIKPPKNTTQEKLYTISQHTKYRVMGNTLHTYNSL